MWIAREFQFYLSSIKSENHFGSLCDYDLFQFYLSSIKRIRMALFMVVLMVVSILP